MGDAAGAASLAIGMLAAAVFALLALATILRGQRYPEAWAEDRKHPIRHTFVATLPIAMLLLATVAATHGERGAAVQALWWIGSLSQLFITVWVLGRWWRGNGPGGLQWASAAPPLFIPVVGNIIAPLAGVSLGQPEWSAAQFGIGLFFWPVVTILILVRVAIQGLWPERLAPTTFIFIAPPAVGGLAALQLGASPMVGWGFWGVGMFTLLWVATQAKRLAAQPFGLPHWGMSFPLAALAALTLRVAPPQGPLAMLGVALLALASLVIAALTLGTLRGLRDGSLLQPEPVAPIVAAAHPG
jgi:tellurite resistance protein